MLCLAVKSFFGSLLPPQNSHQNVSNIRKKAVILNVLPIDAHLVRIDNLAIVSFRVFLNRQQFLFVAIFQSYRPPYPRPLSSPVIPRSASNEES